MSYWLKWYLETLVVGGWRPKNRDFGFSELRTVIGPRSCLSHRELLCHMYFLKIRPGVKKYLPELMVGKCVFRGMLRNQVFHHKYRIVNFCGSWLKFKCPQCGSEDIFIFSKFILVLEIWIISMQQTWKNMHFSLFGVRNTWPVLRWQSRNHTGLFSCVSGHDRLDWWYFYDIFSTILIFWWILVIF